MHVMFVGLYKVSQYNIIRIIRPDAFLPQLSTICTSAGIQRFLMVNCNTLNSVCRYLNSLDKWKSISAIMDKKLAYFYCILHIYIYT